MAPRRVNLEDLLDAEQVAELLGLSSHRAVSIYRTRFEDFPQPVLERSSGRCLMWLRQDVIRFLKQHPRLGQRTGDSGTDPS